MGVYYSIVEYRQHAEIINIGIRRTGDIINGMKIHCLALLASINVGIRKAWYEAWHGRNICRDRINFAYSHNYQNWLNKWYLKSLIEIDNYHARKNKRATVYSMNDFLSHVKGKLQETINPGIIIDGEFHEGQD